MRRARVGPPLIPLATLAFLLAGGVAHSRQADSPTWPHVRGPRYDGTSTERGLADAWPATGPPVLWTRELGQGYSGFVAAGDRVFTQFQTRAGQFLIALRAGSGE